ncbi:tol-pal system protein YbgF [Rheinheimera salexigens]|uniref:Cell division coordinator CpoB n=1 Tax=Rheinheimera salexigens TaxID=1628148 RepID=A0A1E7Q8R4_9GAMM|nr:tol-pal system protein YbgF [Rheinheimera salexigens]OEY70428.1 tol-pal system protein YbgF [Rheinheimera salexigens]
MKAKYTLLAALVLAHASANANPAPVTDINLNRSADANANSSANIYAAAQSAPSGSLEQRLAMLERIVEARSNGQIRMQQQLQVLLDEVSELRGVTETHAYKLEEILQRQRDLYQEIDRRVSEVQQAGANSGYTAPEPQVAETAYSTNISENQDYDKAVNMVLKDRRYDEAIPEFERFIRTYPNSTYAANAHFWLGQLLFNKNELAKAKTQFERVVNTYPDSTKVADALLKLGQVAERENNKAAALKYYQQLVSKFKSGTTAKLAQDRISALQ